MTEQQKQAIIALRKKGLGYKLVSKYLGISLESVKAYCRRVGATGRANTNYGRKTMQDIDICKNCGAILVQRQKMKRRMFCCDSCRQEWWNSHPDAVDRKAYYTFVCANCGKEFSAYGNKTRKYCCHECYIQTRFPNKL